MEMFKSLIVILLSSVLVNNYVLSRFLGFHGEEEIQHHQIDGAAADSQEAGHDAQSQTDRNTNQRICHLHGLDMLLI